MGRRPVVRAAVRLKRCCGHAEQAPRPTLGRATAPEVPARALAPGPYGAWVRPKRGQVGGSGLRPWSGNCPAPATPPPLLVRPYLEPAEGARHAAGRPRGAQRALWRGWRARAWSGCGDDRCSGARAHERQAEERCIPIVHGRMRAVGPRGGLSCAKAQGPRGRLANGFELRECGHERTRALPGRQYA